MNLPLTYTDFNTFLSRPHHISVCWNGQRLLNFEDTQEQIPFETVIRIFYSMKEPGLYSFSDRRIGLLEVCPKFIQLETEEKTAIASSFFIKRIIIMIKNFFILIKDFFTSQTKCSPHNNSCLNRNDDIACYYYNTGELKTLGVSLPEHTFSIPKTSQKPPEDPSCPFSSRVYFGPDYYDKAYTGSERKFVYHSFWKDDNISDHALIENLRQYQDHAKQIF